MKNIIKLFLVLLLALTLVGCSSSKQTSSIDEWNKLGSKYVTLLLEFEPIDKSNPASNDDKGFDDLLQEYFLSSMEEDYLTLHYSVKDYKSMNITKPEVSFGEIKYKDLSNIEKIDYFYNLVTKYDTSKLSYKQMIDYDVVRYSLLEDYASSYFGHYSVLFNQKLDFASNLLTNLEEFKFYDQESLDDYFVLLKDFNRYILDVIQYCQDQIKDGIYMAENGYEYTLDYLQTFLNSENNVLYTSFKTRLDECDFVKEEDKQTLIDENNKLVDEQVIKSYQLLHDTITSWKEKGYVNNKVLSEINKDYAQLVYTLKTSSNKSLSEIFDDTKQYMIYLINSYVEASKDEEVQSEYLEVVQGNGKIPTENILEFLYEKHSQTYPELINLEYKLSPLDKDSASSSIVAYYVSPPLDELSLNVIRTNPNNMSEDIAATYTTLAHEGIPGHMYQYSYYYRTNPANIRTAMSFIGFTEGYAVMAQRSALEYLDISDGVKDIIDFEQSYYFPLYSLIDMAINAMEYSDQQVIDLLSELGFQVVSIDDLKQMFIDRNGVYCSYGNGVSQFYRIKNYAKDELNDKYNEKEFNEVIIRNGHIPFPILEQEVLKYIQGK